MVVYGISVIISLKDGFFFFFFFFNWDSIHARLNSHYEATRPKRRVFVKFGKVNLDISVAILFRLLMRVYLSHLNLMLMEQNILFWKILQKGKLYFRFHSNMIPDCIWKLSIEISSTEMKKFI